MSGSRGMEGYGQPCWVPLSHVCLEIIKRPALTVRSALFRQGKGMASICRAAQVLGSPKEAMAIYFRHTFLLKKSHHFLILQASVADQCHANASRNPINMHEILDTPRFCYPPLAREPCEYKQPWPDRV
jgi:hypothetical protein